MHSVLDERLKVLTIGCTKDSKRCLNGDMDDHDKHHGGTMASANILNTAWDHSQGAGTRVR